MDKKKGAIETYSKESNIVLLKKRGLQNQANSNIFAFFAIS